MMTAPFYCNAEVMCYKNKNCQNGGKCYEDFPKHSFTCSCLPGHTGKHCEYGKFTSNCIAYIITRAADFND